MFEGSKLAPLIREYSTQKPAEDGLVFESLECAENFAQRIHQNNTQIYLCHVQWSRKIEYIYSCISNINMQEYKKSRLKCLRKGGSAAPKGTRYAKGIILIEEIYCVSLKARGDNISCI